MRIGILASFAHAAFVPEWKGRTTGGAEFQLKALGGLLNSLGHEVDFIMEGKEHLPLEINEGKVWRIMPTAGVPLVKLISPKGRTLVRFLKERGIDILIQRGASETTALGNVCAGRAGIPFLFLLASDSDLQPGREILPHPQDQVLFRVALSQTKWVVAQTGEQARRFNRSYGRRAKIIPSLLPPVPSGGFKAGLHDHVLWGGNLRALKRPEWVITLARRFPQMEFLVFGGKAGGHETYATGIISELESLPNVEYFGWVSNHEVPGLFSRARVFLNTSLVEGFPNTFLEAWRQKVPVISTVDPGGLLSKGKQGYYTEDMEMTALLLRQAWEGTLPEYQARLQRAVEYVDDIHGMERVALQWEEMLEMLKMKTFQ